MGGARGTQWIGDGVVLYHLGRTRGARRKEDQSRICRRAADGLEIHIAHNIAQQFENVCNAGRRIRVWCRCRCGRGYTEYVFQVGAVVVHFEYLANAFFVTHKCAGFGDIASVLNVLFDQQGRRGTKYDARSKARDCELPPETEKGLVKGHS